MGLFQLGDFKLHSGEPSSWKIECDALSDSDIEALATLLAWCTPEFSSVEGVPRGGLRIAKALEYHITPGVRRHLIVDDVLTTGASMKELCYQRLAEHKGNITGAVIFARGRCPAWITPLFQMHPIED
jgi:orotate phosphoribosyltransferase